MAILTLLLAAGCSTAESISALLHGEGVLRLPVADMTFRRIDPAQYGTNMPAFFLLETEVTNEMYAQYLRDTKQRKNDSLTVRQARDLRSSGQWSTASPAWDADILSLTWDETTPPKSKERYPVALVTYADATNFCAWLTKQHSQIGLFRLPTKAEWLVAAYGRSRDYPWGEKLDMAIPCVSPSSDRHRMEPVSVDGPTRDITPEGIRHLWGNVKEYIQNPWDSGRSIFGSTSTIHRSMPWALFRCGRSILSTPDVSHISSRDHDGRLSRGYVACAIIDAQNGTAPGC
ncbi:MAG: SUMF1/EgtB/PvdO family nonheme iron enzyme [bacterium]|jgi:formylglycine-generating enzyme required for sulfatase activity